MAKDPAFLFYPSDFNSGTMYMTFEEKGAYITLLICQFHVGHMSEHMIQRMLGDMYSKLWPVLSDKFKLDPQGKYYNERLEEEQNKRKAYCASRSKNRKSKKSTQEKHMKTHMKKHMSTHMENENENEIKDETKNSKKVTIKKFVKPELSEVVSYFRERGHSDPQGIGERWMDHYTTVDWKVGKNKMKDWKASVRNWMRDSSGTSQKIPYQNGNLKEAKKYSQL